MVERRQAVEHGARLVVELYNGAETIARHSVVGYND
jgi:hypothetical protein